MRRAEQAIGPLARAASGVRSAPNPVPPQIRAGDERESGGGHLQADGAPITRGRRGRPRTTLCRPGESQVERDDRPSRSCAEPEQEGSHEVSARAPAPPHTQEDGGRVGVTQGGITCSRRWSLSIVVRVGLLQDPYRHRAPSQAEPSTVPVPPAVGGERARAKRPSATGPPGAAGQANQYELPRKGRHRRQETTAPPDRGTAATATGICQGGMVDRSLRASFLVSARFVVSHGSPDETRGGEERVITRTQPARRPP